MLGGVEVTDKARAHARDMLGIATPSAPIAATPAAAATRVRGRAAADSGDTVRQPRPPVLKGR